ncbi:GNAT family N-acetyltransferase [Sodalis-like endosymbiont of Proechinophthirus fluctus]|uniref:GNAT family N-acetyltransferase n=1 Tax=Sodalis-like endosymbiont of Proechinophthirus fluctus TaxID=1462730 RepID=UPI001FCBFC5E|nr:GNAT family N-acetyltransferase [Sodalis-like endosymbiont of Proechinophthirus fluctus]
MDDLVRGQGIGRLLIEQVYHYTDQETLAGVYWMTQSDNHLAIKLYDKIARKTDFIKYQY